MIHFLVAFGLLSVVSSGVQGTGLSEIWEDLYINQTEACQYCGAMVYTVWLATDYQTLIDTVNITSEYYYCPNNFPQYDPAACANLATNIFTFFYTPFYYMAYPMRDYICVPLCGNSGEGYTLLD